MILGSMLLGMAAFAAIAVFIDPSDGSLDPRTSKILLVATAVTTATNVFLFFLLRRRAIQSAARHASQALEEIERGAMPRELARGMIVCGALAEGAGLLGIVTFFLSRQWVALVALAIAAIAILYLFPTKARLVGAIRGA